MCLFAKSRAEAATFTAAYYTVAAVIPSSQHSSTRAGAESIQLICSGRALQALNPHAHKNYNYSRIVRETGRQVMRKMWRMEKEHDVIGIF